VEFTIALKKQESILCVNTTKIIVFLFVCLLYLLNFSEKEMLQ